MKVFNFSEAKENFLEILDLACEEDVLISQKNGQRFKIVPLFENPVPSLKKSSLDVQGIDCDVTTEEIIETIREFREA